MIDQTTDKGATAPIQSTRSTSDLLTNFTPMCPTCNLPYASSFAGFEHVLTGRSVCAGSLVTQLCKPVEYRVFPLPLSALSMDIEINGKRYRGVLYESDKGGV